MTTPVKNAIDKRKHHAKDLLDLLSSRLLANEGSDLHLSPNQPARIRIDGNLKHKITPDIIKPELLHLMISAIANEDVLQRLQREKRLNFSYVNDLGRFRVNVGLTNGKLFTVLREIQQTIRTPDELGLHPICKTFLQQKQGLYLFSGVTGSGKSVSMASLIDEVNRTSQVGKKIIDLADPIEQIHVSKNCDVIQRERYIDFHTYPEAVEDALRQDPDIAQIGEVRSPEDIKAAIQLAETGHPVITTIHASSSIDVIPRIINSIPAGDRDSVLQSFARVFKGAVYQKLLPRVGGKGRVLAQEIMMSNPTVEHLILEKKYSELSSNLEDRDSGSLPFAVSLMGLYKQGIITEDTARSEELTINSFADKAGLPHNKREIAQSLWPV